MFGTSIPARSRTPNRCHSRPLSLPLVRCWSRVAAGDSHYRCCRVGQIDRIPGATFGLKPIEPRNCAPPASARKPCPGTLNLPQILREEVAYGRRKALGDGDVGLWRLADGARTTDIEIQLPWQSKPRLGSVTRYVRRPRKTV